MQTAGYGDDLSGYFFGFSGSQFGVMRKYNGTETWTFQSSWSEEKFNGSNSSIMTLDPTKGNVYQIRFQWLGYGAIRYYMEDSGSAGFVLCHIDKYANQYTQPTVPNPSLPVTFEVKNWTNPGVIKLETSSIAGFVEGKENTRFQIRNVVDWSTNATTETNILTLKNTTTFHNVRNRVFLIPDVISVCVVGSSLGRINIYRNINTAGMSFTNVRTGLSVAQFSVTATGALDVATPTYASNVGKKLGTYFIAGNSQQVIECHGWNIRVRPGETITIAGLAGAANSPISCSLAWHEAF